MVETEENEGQLMMVRLKMPFVEFRDMFIKKMQASMGEEFIRDGLYIYKAIFLASSGVDGEFGMLPFPSGLQPGHGELFDFMMRTGIDKLSAFGLVQMFEGWGVEGSRGECDDFETWREARRAEGESRPDFGEFPGRREYLMLIFQTKTASVASRAEIKRDSDDKPILCDWCVDELGEPGGRFFSYLKDAPGGCH